MTISPGIEVEAHARLCASLDGLSSRMDREASWRQKVAGAVFPLEFAGSVTLAAGAGTFDQPDAMAVKTGYIWMIRRFTVQGFSAGTVNVYRNSVTGEPILPFATPAVDTFGKGQMRLLSGDRVIVNATGISGTVSFWASVDAFESWYLPFYLG